MKITMITNMAGPQLSASAGQTIEVSREQGEELVVNGFATCDGFVPETDTGEGEGDEPVDIDYAACSDDELADYAEQADLPKNITNRNTIIKRLQEVGFVPDGETL